MAPKRKASGTTGSTKSTRRKATTTKQSQDDGQGAAADLKDVGEGAITEDLVKEAKQITENYKSASPMDLTAPTMSAFLRHLGGQGLHNFAADVNQIGKEKLSQLRDFLEDAFLRPSK